MWNMNEIDENKIMNALERSNGRKEVESDKFPESQTQPGADTAVN